MNYKLKILILLVIMLFASQAYSENVLSIRDTVLDRGIICKIPIYLKTDIADIKSVEIKLKFNAFALDIPSAIGGTDFIIQDQTPNSLVNLDNLDESTVTITSSNIKNSNLPLCIILVEGLAGKDTVSNIVPLELKINGEVISTSQFIPGKIKINSIPIVPDLQEYIGINHPNPFNSSTTFDFFLDKDSKVSFSIYSVNGRRVYKFPDIKNSVEFSILDQINIPQEFTENTILKAGKYKLNITPNNYDFATGPYYLIFRTDTKAHKVNFMYLKY